MTDQEQHEQLINEAAKLRQRVIDLGDQVTRARSLHMLARDMASATDLSDEWRNRARRALGMRRPRRGKRG